MADVKVGKITHYYDKIGVAVLAVSEAPLKTGVHLGGDPLCPVVEIESFPNGRAEDQGEDHSGQLLIIYD